MQNETTAASAALTLAMQARDNAVKILDAVVELALEMIEAGRDDDAAALLRSVRARLHGVPTGASIN